MLLRILDLSKQKRLACKQRLTTYIPFPMKSTYNLTGTQQTLSPDIVEPDAEKNKMIRELLTFDSPPDTDKINQRALQLSFIVAESFCKYALIDAPPFLIPSLDSQLRLRGIVPLYKYSDSNYIYCAPYTRVDLAAFLASAKPWGRDFWEN